jgi:hypothetical protein
MTSSALLQLISSSVTPVVMISACAALILGVNNKLNSISDRLRLILAECRLPSITEARSSQLIPQATAFYRRFRVTWYALLALYAAVVAFTITTLLILLTEKRILSFTNGTLISFIAGIAMMLFAAAAELVEIKLSHDTLRIEMNDITQGMRIH